MWVGNRAIGYQHYVRQCSAMCGWKRWDKFIFQVADACISMCLSVGRNQNHRFRGQMVFIALWLHLCIFHATNTRKTGAVAEESKLNKSQRCCCSLKEMLCLRYNTWLMKDYTLVDLRIIWMMRLMKGGGIPGLSTSELAPCVQRLTPHPLNPVSSSLLCCPKSCPTLPYRTFSGCLLSERLRYSKSTCNDFEESQD